MEGFGLGILVGIVFIKVYDWYSDYKDGKQHVRLYVNTYYQHRDLKAEALTNLYTRKERKWYWKGILKELRSAKFAIWN